MAGSKRIEYFDIAKGIAMLAIIAGHFGVSQINGFVYTFHVPIFFIISGYFFRDRNGFTKTKARQLLVPYGITAAAVTIIVTFEELLKCILGKSDLSSVGQTLVEYFFMSIYGNGSGSNHVFHCELKYIGAIWFLLALFWGFLFLQLLLRVKSKRVQFVASCAALVFAALTAKYVWLPFSVQSGMAAVLFLWIGKWIADSGGMNRIIGNKLCVASCAVVWAAAIVFSYKNGIMAIVRADFPSCILDIGGGVAGSIVILWISEGISRIGVFAKPLLFIGENSLIVLCFHLAETKILPWGYFYSKISSRLAAVAIAYVIKILWASVGVYAVKLLKYRKYRKYREG